MDTSAITSSHLKVGYMALQLVSRILSVGKFTFTDYDRSKTTVECEIF
jgi:hypothetical protein